MISYLLRRGFEGIIVIFLVSICVFSLLHLLPGNPAYSILAGLQGPPTIEQVETVTRQLGLDKPIHMQYLRWMGKLLRLDFGRSYIHSSDIREELSVRLTRSLQLIIPALAIGLLVGIPLGVISAVHHGKPLDTALTVSSLVAYSTPVFVVGALLVVAFALTLGWFPTSGYTSLSKGFGPFLQHAILPILTLSISPIAVTVRMTRSCMLETMYTEYVQTARAKGISESRVLFRHVLRSALPPIVTVVALQTGHMFAGSVLVESLFTWPGMSGYLLQAVNTHDYPVIQMVVLVVALIFIGLNLIADIVCGFLDPRIIYD